MISKRRVVVTLRGGLGNQMFQYAAALRVALSNKAELVLDTRSGFRSDPYCRSYAIDCFALNRAVSTGVPLPSSLVELTMAAARRFREIWRMRNGLYYDPALRDLRVRDSTKLVGYFHSADYFSDIESEVRKEFAFRSTVGLETRGLIAAAEGSNSVSIHIRRNHGVINGQRTQVSATYDVCPDSYYLQAIQYIQKQVAPCKLFLFSDDIAWVKSHLRLENCVAVEGQSSSEDLRVMASCKHHVISNSTFSWWGAWLNPDPAKLVVAPRAWMRNLKDENLIPAGWIRL